MTIFRKNYKIMKVNLSDDISYLIMKMDVRFVKISSKNTNELGKY